jgi:hypothetical protein
MRTGGRYSNTLNAAKLGQKFEPLILRAETLVGVGANGSPNNNALINPTGEPWEIHEIKFGVRRETNLTYARATGAALDVNISWCGKKVTDGFVPVWNCGAAQSVEEFRPLSGVAALIVGEYWRAQDSFYSWKLDHPLYVPPRTALAVEFRNNGLINIPLRSSIALLGRVMPRSAKPTKVKVPYVSAFKSNFYDFLLAGGPETSPESVLFNQLTSNLTIERFIGRIASRIQTDENDGSFVYVDQIARLAFRGSIFSAKHRMTTGDIVARDWVKFGDIYGWRNYKWNVRHVLEPDVGHIIELRKNAPPSTPSATTLNSEIIDATAQAIVSMVGWREEEVP